MIRKLTALLAAFALFATAMAPTNADARDRRDGYYDRHHNDGYYDRDYRHRRYYRDHDDDDGDAVAAGVIGLVLGLALGAAASQPRQRRDGCYDNYRRCDGYGQQGYYDPRYDQRYYDPRAAYARDYGYPPPPPGYYNDPYARPQCTRRERQWDRYANRYVAVDVPC